MGCANRRRKRWRERIGGEPAPRLGEACRIGMPVHQQHRELVGGQRMQRRTRSLRPPREMPAREPFEAQPEALSVVDQQFDGGRAPVAK